MIWIGTYSILISIVLRVLIRDNVLYLLSTIPAGIVGGMLLAWVRGAFDE